VLFLVLPKGVMMLKSLILITIIFSPLSRAWASAGSDELLIGKPLNVSRYQLIPIYNNDFSANNVIDFERLLSTDKKRTRLPEVVAQWVVEGKGGVDICQGKLWVAPIKFDSCGKALRDDSVEPSHMVVWNKKQFPKDLLFEFTVNHQGSDDGLTLLFFSALAKNGKSIFDLTQPLRQAKYKKYYNGLSNYTVSYWSRNQHANAIKNREQYSNRIRKNPGMNLVASGISNTETCNNCDIKIRVLKVANSIMVEVNGEVVSGYEDQQPLGAGYIGLRSMRGVKAVTYDDFNVWQIKLSD
jgi:hypothetical protein